MDCARAVVGAAMMDTFTFAVFAMLHFFACGTDEQRVLLAGAAIFSIAPPRLEASINSLASSRRQAGRLTGNVPGFLE